VLLVEDEAMVRSFMVGTLRAGGFEVLEAANGADALELATRHTGPIDLLVTDVIMPRMGGVELASRLVEHRPQLKVLFVSGYTGSPAGSLKLHGPGGTLLSKPFTAGELLEQVRERLGDED